MPAKEVVRPSGVAPPQQEVAMEHPDSPTRTPSAGLGPATRWRTIDIVTVAVLAVVFSGLLMAGPPTEWRQ